MIGSHDRVDCTVEAGRPRSLLSPPGRERKRQEWRKTVVFQNRGIMTSAVQFRGGHPVPSVCLHVSRRVKTQCSFSSGFSNERRPWIGSSVKYDCSLVTRRGVRSHTQIVKRIATWTSSSALIGLGATVRTLWFQSPFVTIDMQRGGVKPARTDTEEMHNEQGQNHPHLRQTSCSRSSLRLIFLRCVPSCRKRRLQSTPVDQKEDS